MLKISSRTKSVLAVTFAYVITNALSACTSVPSVKMVKRQGSSKTNTRTIATQQVKPLKASYAQAGIACDNQNMANRSRDNDANNDLTRILIVDEVNNSGIVVADIAIDCADYHAKQRAGMTVQSNIVQRQTINMAQHYPEFDPNFTSVTTRVDYTKTVTKDAQPLLVNYPSSGLNHHDQISNNPRAATSARLIPTQQIKNNSMTIKASHITNTDLRRHRVARGETIYSIARRYCVSQDVLTDINNIDSHYTIHPDQHLRIPQNACK